MKLVLNDRKSMYKTHVVTKGFKQTKHVKFDEIFSLVAKS